MKYAKEILKVYKPEKRHFGQLVFVDEKLRSFGTIELMKLFNSTRKGFLVTVGKRGKYKALNPYRDTRNKILPRTLGRLLKNKNEIERDIKKRKRDEKNNRAIKPTKIVPAGSNSLPLRVVVLDIETTGKLDENPNPKRISVVGIKEYNLVAGGFQPSPFEHYDGSDNWASLKSRLKQPFDIILGHNLFGFDYYFLEGVLDLQRLMPKTVDLFLWLYTCTGSRSWLGLDKLCRMNLGFWKLRSGKSVKELASLADKSLLHRYNERDLDLTFRLWLHAIEQKTIKTWAFGFLKASECDLDYLSGRKHLVDYPLWMEKRRTWDSNQPSPLNPAVIVKKLGSHDADKICWQTYTVITCKNCKVATVYLVSEWYERVSEKNADESPHRVAKQTNTAYKLRCAKCNVSVRSRSSTPPIEIGSFKITEESKYTSGYDLDLNRKQPVKIMINRGNEFEFIGRGYFKNGLDTVLEMHLRRNINWVKSSGIGKDYCCQTCGHLLTIHDLPFVHPIFKTSLCQACIRLGRHRYFHAGKWLPDLKRRRFLFSDDLIPMNGAWNRTAFYTR